MMAKSVFLCSAAAQKALVTDFLKNVDIQGGGGVLASPDKKVPGGGSYYFHWMRDAALTARALVRNATAGVPVDSHLQHYVDW